MFLFLWWVVKYVLIVYSVGCVVVFVLALFEKDDKFGSRLSRTKAIVSLLPALIWPLLAADSIRSKFIQDF